jgi:polyhydroxyalkanoate synthesis regulator phasin
MKRSRTVVGIAVFLAILGVVAVGTVAYAQDDDGSGFDFRGKFKEALAEILGVTVEEYDTAVDKAQDQVVDEALAEGWLTEEQAELFRWRMDQAPGMGRHGMGKSFGAPLTGFRGTDGDSLLSVAAEELGMKLTELLTELQDGKTIAQLAQDKGIDTQKIVDAYLAEVQENVDAAVDQGRMTQKQADYYLEQAEARVTEQLENTWDRSFRGFGGRQGGGMRFPGLGGF